MKKALLALFSLICWIVILSNNIPTVRAECVCLPSLAPCTVNADCGGGVAVCASECTSSSCVCFTNNAPCNATIPCAATNVCYLPCPLVTTTATTIVATTTGFPSFLLPKLLLLLDTLYVATLLMAIYVLLVLAILVAFYLLNFT
ncbi:hypothetical protein T265_14112, partial [Opisthorchis viverrini]